MKRILLFLSLSLCMNFIAPIAFSQEWQLTKKLSPTEIDKYLQYGYSVDVFKNTLAIGSIGADTIGAVYIYRKSEKGIWHLLQIIKPENGSIQDQFGASVSISENHLAIGSIWHDYEIDDSTKINEAGAVYTYRKSVDGLWVNNQILHAFDPGSADHFGISLDLQNSELIIGSIWNDYDEKGKKYRPDAGAAYYFQFENGNWNFKQKIVANDRVGIELFGISVSLDNEYAAIGAYRNSVDSKGKKYVEFSGAAYVFKKNSDGFFEEQQKIFPDKRRKYAFFGYSVNIEENELLVSEYHSSDTNNENRLKEAGAVYSFLLQGEKWVQNQKIVPLNRHEKAYFGEFIDRDGDILAIGAMGENYNEKGESKVDSAGAIYVFEKEPEGNWSQKTKLVHRDRHTGDQLGVSVAIDDKQIIGGAWGKSVESGGNQFYDVGAAYIFSYCSEPEITIQQSDQKVFSEDTVYISASGADYFDLPEELIENGFIIPRRSSSYSIRAYDKNGCNSIADFDIEIIEIPDTSLNLEELTFDENFEDEISPQDDLLEKLNSEVSNDLPESTISEEGDTLINSQLTTLKEPFEKAKQKETNTERRNIFNSEIKGNYDVSGTKDDLIVSTMKIDLIKGERQYLETSVKTVEGIPVINVNTFLKNDLGQIIASDATDVSGIVKYPLIDSNKDYQVSLDLNDPRLKTLVEKDNRKIKIDYKSNPRDFGTLDILTKVTYKKSKEPVPGFQLILTDTKSEMLKGISNNEGKFRFEKLNSDREYRVNANILNPEIGFKIYQGTELVDFTFKKYIVNLQSNELLIPLNFEESNDPVIGLNVLLFDEDGNFILERATDENGLLKFQNLNSDKNYYIQASSYNPNFRINHFYNGKSIEIDVQKFIRIISDYNILASLQYVSSGAPAVGVDLLLFDNNGYLVMKAASNSLGQYKFEHLRSDTDYQLSLDISSKDIAVRYFEVDREIVLKTTVKELPNSEFEHIFRMEYKDTGAPVSDVKFAFYSDELELKLISQTNANGEIVYRSPNRDPYIPRMIGPNNIQTVYGYKGEDIIIDPLRFIEMVREFEVIARLEFPDGTPIREIEMLLIDERGQVINMKRTSSEGLISFDHLNPDKYYYVIPNPELSQIKTIYYLDNRRIKMQSEQLAKELGGFDYLLSLEYDDNSEAIPEIEIGWILDNEIYYAKTDENGRLLLENLNSDQKPFFFIKEGLDKIHKEYFLEDRPLVVHKEYILKEIANFEIFANIEYEDSGEPVSGIDVVILGNKGNSLFRGKSNEKGILYYNRLRADQWYSGIIDKNSPDLDVLATFLGQKIILETRRVKDKLSGLEILAKMIYPDNNAPAIGMPVKLVDKNGLVLKRGMTDENGEIEFNIEGDPDEEYRVLMEIDEEEYKAQDFQNVYFDFDDSSVRESELKKVKAVAKFLKDNPGHNLKIIAHTDNKGSAEYNLKLSASRSKSVVEEILKMGLSQERISQQAAGLSRPIAPNDNEYGRQLNRRVEFILQ